MIHMYIHLHVGTFINGENKCNNVTFCINKMSKYKADMYIRRVFFLANI